MNKAKPFDIPKREVALTVTTSQADDVPRWHVV